MSTEKEVFVYRSEKVFRDWLWEHLADWKIGCDQLEMLYMDKTGNVVAPGMAKVAIFELGYDKAKAAKEELEELL